MLDLVITTKQETGWIPSEQPVGEQEVWRDEDGVVFARGQRVGDSYLMQVPEVGAFRFGPNKDTIEAMPEPSASRDRVVDAYRRLVLPNAIQALGQEVLHASAVIAPSGVVAICGPRKAGKSTTAYGLSQREYRLWADDAVALEIADQSAMAVQLPFTLRLRPPSVSFFGADGQDSSPMSDDSRHGQERAPLGAIFVLERTSVAQQGGVEISRLGPHDAFLALLGNAYWFSLSDQDRWRRMVSRYLDLSVGVPVFKLRFRAELASFAEMLDRVEQTLDRLEAQRP